MKTHPSGVAASWASTPPSPGRSPVKNSATTTTDTRIQTASSSARISA